MKTAILVDGGFYRRCAQAVFGDISTAGRANELYDYCNRHLLEHIDGLRSCGKRLSQNNVLS